MKQSRICGSASCHGPVCFHIKLNAFGTKKLSLQMIISKKCMYSILTAKYILISCIHNKIMARPRIRFLVLVKAVVYSDVLMHA